MVMIMGDIYIPNIISNTKGDENPLIFIFIMSEYKN